MKRRGGREVFRGPVNGGWWRFGLAYLVVLIVTGFALDPLASLPLAWRVLSLGLGMVLLAAVLRWLGLDLGRREIRLDDAGLSDVRWPSRRFWCGWDEVEQVVVVGTTARIVTRRGPIVLGQEIEGWHRLVEALRCRIEGVDEAAGQDGEIAADLFGRWVGRRAKDVLSVSAELTATAQRPGTSDIWACTAIMATMGVAQVLGLLSNPLWLSVGVGLVVGLTLAVEMFFSTLELRADPHGLRYRCGRGPWRRELSCGWADLRSLEEHHRHAVIRTTAGDMTLPLGSEDGKLLADAVRYALRAREAGHALPQRLGVPDAAISRAAGETAVAERGLSRER